MPHGKVIGKKIRVTPDRLTFYRSFFILGVFIITLLLFNNYRLMKLNEEMSAHQADLEYVVDEYKSELLFINDSINHGFDMGMAKDYIDLDSPEITKLASELNSPEDMYYFVLQNISYSLEAENIYPTDTLSLKDGDCFSKSNLLASLLRARGYPQEKVKVVAGAVYVDREARLVRVHAWVEFFDADKKRWFVLDSTPLLEISHFEKYSRPDYYYRFVNDIFFEYNDGFMAVSSPIAEDIVSN